MSLSTFSIFYYGFDITPDNYQLDFNEGAGQLTANIAYGSYTPTELSVELQNALNFIGTQAYIVTFNRSLRAFEVSAASAFDILVTGTSGAKANSIIGYTFDSLSLTNHIGNSCGSTYEPQFIIQDHISSDNSQKLINPSVNVSSSGRVKVVRFGIEKFVVGSFKFITNKITDGRVIKNNPQGVQSLQAFLQFLILKKKIEYMPDILDRNTFQTLMLESTDVDQKGTGYELKEMYDKDLPGFFDSGKLKFRVIE